MLWVAETDHGDLTAHSSTYMYTCTRLTCLTYAHTHALQED